MGNSELWVPPKGLPDVWLPPRPGKKGSQDQSDWAKEQFIRLVEHGYNYSQAAQRLGLTYKICGGQPHEREILSSRLLF